MAFEFKLPDLGEGITSGEIKKWLVRKGDHVNEDDSIAEVETDKAVVELPSPVSGTIEDLKAGEGSKASVGDVIATIKEAGKAEGAAGHGKPEPEKAHEEAAVEARQPEAKRPQEERLKPQPLTQPRAEIGLPVLATPATRALAKELKVDIDEVTGSGPGGRITDEDVKKAARKPEQPKRPQAPPEAEAPALAAPAGREARIPLRGIRRTIADHLVQAVRSTAQVTIMDDVDMTCLAETRRGINAKLAEGKKVTLLALVAKAAVASLRQHPMVNASVDEEKGEIVEKHYYNIGIAVDTDRGLIVPVVRDADQKSMLELSGEIRALTEVTRTGNIGVEQLKGGTFTIANIGSIGGLFATPIVNYPESAILETQQVRDVPRVVDGQIVVRKVMNLSLTIDHRIIDGAEGQRFLNDLKKFLEEPELLFASM